MTTVVFGVDGEPVEIAPGRGDLRYSSVPMGSIRQASGNARLVGARQVSYAELFATQPWIGAAVMRMLTWAVRVPLKVYRRKSEDERVRVRHDEHPFARMTVRPWLGDDGGQVATQAALVQSILGPMCIHGNALFEIAKSGGEEWLKPMDWRNSTPIGNRLGESIDGWRYQPSIGSSERYLTKSNVLRFGWWSPLGPLGVSPLEMLGTTVGVEDSAQRYQRSIFENGARPPSAIETTVDFLGLDEIDRKELLDQLREDVDDLYTGPERGGKPAILPPGLQWKAIAGSSAHEAQLIEQRKVAREEVAGVYMIPPPMLGILDNATYSNIQTQKEMIYSDSVGPPLVLAEQILTATIARDYYGEDDLYAEFDFGPVLRGDRLKEITALRAAIGGAIYTPNEARRALNLPPSKAKMADELLYPANNLAPMGDEPEEQEQDDTPPAPQQPPAVPQND